MITRHYSRWAPLRASAWAACGFIVLRLIYRILFLGASGGGVQLWYIRPVSLPAPFSLISVGGRVTTGGVWSTVLDALPFAAVILAFGLLFSLVDVRSLIAESARLRIGRGPLTALAIGLATYPALVLSWRSIREVHKLRRESGGFSVLPTLFERTLERAQTLAASMEVRGFGRPRHIEVLDCSRPATARGLALGFAGAALTSVPDFTLNLGDVVLLEGATGSGKTSVLRALAGLHVSADGGMMSGQLEVGGLDRVSANVSHTSEFVGLVGQRVRESFVASTVSEEVGFALAVQGLSRAQREVRVTEVLRLLNIERFAQRQVEELSAGEAVVVALGAALATRPTLLLLDEPFADLDAHQALFVASTLATLASHTRMCIVIAEHRTELIAPFATARISLEVARASTSPQHSFEAAGSPVHPSIPIVALVGQNGSGKTTRLVARAKAHPGHAALVPESLGDFFCRDSVEAEMARSDKTARVAIGTTRLYFERLVGSHAVDDSQHPRDLSAGQQVALAIAISLAANPAELLIDEPTRGLDARAKAELAGLLRSCAGHTAVTVATHDADFVAVLDARVDLLSSAEVAT